MKIFIALLLLVLVSARLHIHRRAPINPGTPSAPPANPNTPPPATEKEEETVEEGKTETKVELDPKKAEGQILFTVKLHSFEGVPPKEGEYTLLPICQMCAEPSCEHVTPGMSVSPVVPAEAKIPFTTSHTYDPPLEYALGCKNEEECRSSGVICQFIVKKADGSDETEHYKCSKSSVTFDGEVTGESCKFSFKRGWPQNGPETLGEDNGTF